MLHGPRYVKRLNYERALQIARHECGHYIAARALGFETGALSVELLYPNGHRGGALITLPHPLRSIVEACSYLERRIQILYAGVLAESLKDGKINEEKAREYVSTGGSEDFAKVKELTHLLRNFRYCDEPVAEAQRHLDEICERLWANTIRLILTEQDHIEGLARRLATGVTEFGMPSTITPEQLGEMTALNERFKAQNAS